MGVLWRVLNRARALPLACLPWAAQGIWESGVNAAGRDRNRRAPGLMASNEGQALALLGSLLPAPPLMMTAGGFREFSENAFYEKK